jgi:hypothetical protein
MNTRLLSWCAGAVALLLFTTAVAADKAPERKVEGTTITSARDPAITINLPSTAQYLGADRWDLYGICDAELHLFVEADAQKRVQRLYWVQFESYLPDNTHVYAYPFTETVTHAGRLFDVTAVFGPTGSPVRAGSDSEHMRAMLARGGYTMPAESMNVRLVNLLDDAKRKELMFIYAEDLALSDASAEELNKSGNGDRWSTLKAQLIERARQRIEIVDTGR